MSLYIHIETINTRVCIYVYTCIKRIFIINLSTFVTIEIKFYLDNNLIRVPDII